MSRYEVKFITNQENYDSVMLWIKSSILSFKKSYPDRIVNNIYFDDLNFENFHDNVVGISKRRKVRYRWYQNSNTILPGYLEIKSKQNNLGSKQLYKIDNVDFDINGSWEIFINFLKTKLTKNSNIYLENLRAVLFNSYHRKYFESQNKKIRITVDQKQKFYKQNSSLRPNFTRPNPSLDVITIEIKAEQKYQELVSKLLNNIPFRQTKYSKYVVGCS